MTIFIQIYGFHLCKMAPLHLHGWNLLKQRVIGIIQFAPRLMWKIPLLPPYIIIKVTARFDTINLQSSRTLSGTLKQ